jgi:hypothetical protein
MEAEPRAGACLTARMLPALRRTGREQFLKFKNGLAIQNAATPGTSRAARAW